LKAGQPNLQVVDLIKLFPFKTEVGEQNHFVSGELKPVQIFDLVLQRFPQTEVQIQDYYTLTEFFSSVGGSLKIVQIVVGLFVATFIYKEYSAYMARRLDATGISEEERVEAFQKRLSAEGIYRLYDRIDQLEKRLQETEKQLRDKV